MSEIIRNIDLATLSNQINKCMSVSAAKRIVVAATTAAAIFVVVVRHNKIHCVNFLLSSCCLQPGFSTFAICLFLLRACTPDKALSVKFRILVM